MKWSRLSELDSRRSDTLDQTDRYHVANIEKQNMIEILLDYSTILKK